MQEPERHTDEMSERPWRRRLAIAGVALTAILAGGVFALVVSGRDDARPLASETSPTPTTTVQTPSPTASPSASAAPSATPAQTPEPTITPAPTSDGGAWIGPERISTREYHDVSLVLDSEGSAHVAAAMGPHGSDGIWYVTNASGEWLRERLRSPDEGWFWHQQPAIARDMDGSLWIVYAAATETGSHLRMLTNRSGTWSSEAILDCYCIHPSLAVAHGVAHLVAEEPPPFEAPMFGGPDYSSVIYMTNAGGLWSRELVAAPGRGPALGVDEVNARPHIVFSDDSLIYAQPQGEALALHLGPGASLHGYPPQLAIGQDGVLHVVWGDAGTLYLATRTRVGWGTPTELMTGLTDVRPTGIAVSPDGTLHLSITGHGEGVWHATIRRGALDVRQLATGYSGVGWSHGSDVAVDAAGRPHLIYTAGEEWLPGEGLVSPHLWYAIGPGD